MNCPQCTFVARSKAGLAAHQRWAHAQPTAKAKRAKSEPGLNVAAMEETLAQLRLAGRLERVDAARVQALRSMAAALDINPFNSQMWREYREALERLTADDSGAGVDDLINELSAPVRDQA